MGNKFLSVDEVATGLMVKPHDILKWINDGKIKAEKNNDL